jgi:hypothetical protein
MEPVALSLTIQRQFAPGQSATSTITCAAEGVALFDEYHRLAEFGPQRSVAGALNLLNLSTGLLVVVTCP